MVAGFATTGALAQYNKASFVFRVTIERGNERQSLMLPMTSTSHRIGAVQHRVGGKQILLQSACFFTA